MNWPYVDATYPVTRYNRHTFVYTRAHSTTRAHATVQQLRFVAAHSACNAIANLELRQSYKALCDNLVPPSATTLSNISWREDALTLDAIQKQLPSHDQVSFALIGWSSLIKSAITLLIAYNMDWNWALREVQLAIDEVDCLFLSRFAS